MKRAAIIGHFGANENITDGQTIKTRILYGELSAASGCQIKKIDTYDKRKKPIRLFLNVLITLFTTKKIILLVSGNGMKFFFPLLYSASVILKTEIYHDVIGGNLDQYIIRNGHFAKYLNSFVKNWVETDALRRRVEALGIGNCEVIPNFKRLSIVDETAPAEACEEPYRLCTFSRVMREKGIEDAVKAVQEINERAGKTVCTLDIYGMIDADYEKCFREMQKNTSPAIRYCGIVPYDKSVETIQRYYCLLFPSRWRGEGFPGTVIDAFSAGLPVIATDWHSNREIIDHMVNGLIYPGAGFASLADCITWMIAHPDEHRQMRAEAVKSARKYQPDLYIAKIRAEMGI